MFDFLFPPEDAGKTAQSLEAKLLLEAAKAGNMDKVQTMLKYGANLRCKDDKGLTPLHHACWNGDVDMARMILEHGGPELLQAKSGYGSTPLHAAADKGQTNTVRFLLESGSNVNAKNAGGLSPLHYTAWNDHTDTTRVLLAGGGDKDAKNIEGCTPLHLASMFGNSGVAVLLLDHGADPYLANMKLETPLDLAKNPATAAVLRVRAIDLDKRTTSSAEMRRMMDSLIQENNKLLTDRTAHLDNEKKILELREQLAGWKAKEPERRKEHEEIRAKFLARKQKDDVMYANIEALQNRMNEYKRMEVQRKNQIKYLEAKLSSKDEPLSYLTDQLENLSKNLMLSF